ncbi:MAG TPA: exodeoxyribonuclease VII small subunit [Intrasporangiaceae bacterium]|nr:exodeoxyribonuclease VII small subunit [Intrasporangiaceae bacterium]
MSPTEDTSAADEQGREIAELTYEQAKEELTAIVATLESGSASLEESMRLWERGEALAAHCSQWLDQAQAAVENALDEDADA